MKIAIASGKGGTGKTTVAASMAVSLDSFNPLQNALDFENKNLHSSISIQFIDCDVEAPNSHLYLNPHITDKKTISIPVPSVSASICSACGKCSEVCQYHAITMIGNNVMVFPQLCHGCGSCKTNCPEEAIQEIQGEIGSAEMGEITHGLSFFQGKLNIGEPMAVPIIRQLKKWAFNQHEDLAILDCPPGNSCPLVETLQGVDFVLYVTEPTPFGLHDLKLAVEITRQMNIPGGIIINRSDLSSNSEVERYASDMKIPVLMYIPYEREIAEATARGATLLEIHPEYQDHFNNLYANILSLATHHDEF